MTDPVPRVPTVFLSYASENREAARRIGAALPAYGLEVWYDESELGGGDAWDQKIRRQIRECDYFMPLVSAQTEARREGYFRREWRLAVERTLDMADDHTFLLPVVLDDTDALHARVPEKFQSVQWLRLPGGESTPAFEALCRRIASGEVATPPPRASIHPGGAAPGAQQPSQPSQPSQPAQAHSGPAPFRATPFPPHEPGHGMRYGVEVLGWTFRNAFALWSRLPRWIRWSLLVWAAVALMSRCNHEGAGSRSSRRVAPPLPPATQQKLEDFAHSYSKDSSGNLARLGALVSKEFGDEAKGHGASVLAVPFASPAGDAAALKLANVTFAQTYTRIAVTRHSQLSIDALPGPGCDLKTLLARGAPKEQDYVLCGEIAAGASAVATLGVVLVDVENAAVLWRRDYPVSGADPAAIALEVAEHVPEKGPDD